MLEALLKRVNGLEKRLKEENKSDSPGGADNASCDQDPANQEEGDKPELAAEFVQTQEMPRPEEQSRSPCREPMKQHGGNGMSESIAFTDALLDTYFAQIHNKP